MGEVNILCEFATMQANLSAKKATIHHGEVPQELVQQSLEGDDVDPPQKEKKRKREHSVEAPWHPKLKEALVTPLKQAGNPTFSKILNFCKKDVWHIFPKQDNVCAPHAMFGSCFHGAKCRRIHKSATDAQVPLILKVLEPFLKDPKKISEGQ